MSMPLRRELSLQETAERAVRRGELREALQIYRELLQENDKDESIAARISAIESLLQPQEAEQVSRAPALASLTLNRPPTLEQTAEMLFGIGDLEGAIATYERVLKARPDNQLARERSEELKRTNAQNPAIASPEQEPKSISELLEMLLSRIASRRKF